MIVNEVKRQIILERDGDDITLPDVNPKWSIEEVMDYYSGQYPEMTTGKYEVDNKGEKVIYRISSEKLGTKG